MSVALKNGLKSRIRPNVNSDQPFERLVKEDTMRVQNYDTLMLGKVKESENSKQAVFSQREITSPKLHYLMNCIDQQHIVLPLLDKVRGKTLCLQSYTLSKGHCRALASAIKVLDD